MRTIYQRFFILLVILLIPLALSGCSRSQSNAQADADKPQAKVINVKVMPIELTPIKDVLLLPGETEAFDDVQLAANTDGQVEWIGTDEGKTIQKDQLLAKIDVAVLKATLDQAEAAYELGDTLYARRQKLFERQMIPKEELDQSRTERTIRLTNLQRAKAEYNHGFVHSPIDGVINHLFVDPGEFVNRGEPVVNIVNVDKIKINVSVPEMDVAYLRVAQEVRVTIDALPDLQLRGTINSIAYKADPVTKTFKVQVLVDNPEHRIRPGMITRVAFLRRVVSDGLSIPLFALVDKGGERIVFVEEAGVARARTVSTGVIEEDRIQIVEGLNVGDRLIVAGQREVEEGMAVQVQ